MHPIAILFDMILFRRNPLIYVAAFTFVGLMMMVTLYTIMSSGKSGYGLRAFSSDLALLSGVASRDLRPPLAGVLPPVPPGWTRRGYLRGDGEEIVAGADRLGRTARLRAAGDLERFGLFAGDGANQLAVVYARGSERVAIGLRRPSPLADNAIELAADFTRSAPFDAEIGLELDGTVFYRRARELPETDAPMPYDLYRAEMMDGRVIELFTNAPDAVAEALLSGFALRER